MSTFKSGIAADYAEVLLAPTDAPDDSPRCGFCNGDGYVEINDRFRPCDFCDAGESQRLRLGSLIRIVVAAIAVWAMLWAVWTMLP